MTDPEVKDDNAVRVYVPTDVRPEMLDGPEAQTLRDELDETRAQLAKEQTAHATLRALWDARCGTIASVRARLEAAERVVDDVFGSRGMAETLNDLCTCGGGGAEHPHSCGACRLYRVTRRLLRSALDALPAAAPALAGDDS